MPKGGKTFMGLTTIYALVCLTFLIRFPKGDIHMAMDAWHVDTNPFLMSWLTYLGDGLVFVAVVILLIAMRKPARMVLSVAVAGIAVLLLIGILKNAVFSDISRPWGFFEEGSLRLIDGLDQHRHKSFPSGHTTAAFTLYGLLAFWFNRRWSAVLLFLVAATVAYSRMYLNQHFLIDVFAGGIIGALIAWGTYYMFFRFPRGPRWKKAVF